MIPKFLIATISGGISSSMITFSGLMIIIESPVPSIMMSVLAFPFGSLLTFALIDEYTDEVSSYLIGYKED